MTTALITGASAGLGAAFARRLAADGLDLVLVARDRGRLESIANELRATHGVRIEVLPADLTVPWARARVERRLTATVEPIDLLVNNAGVEADDELPAAPMTDLQAEIDLNVTAVLRLTRAALPGMLARDRGSVINVASFAGYLPARGSAYGASKAWVLSFTDTVAASVAGTGVRAIALCAGRLRTARHAQVGPPGSPLWIEPADAVDVCLRDLSRGRRLSTPGWLYRLLVGTLEAPRRSLRLLARLAGRGREQQPPTPRPVDPAAAADPEQTMRLAA
ncbi:SDR family NAD(P)-dependent oxidoreductase [Pseudonocardia asaccharolytica]|uniref:Short-chain dehydrogenase n=1 Tax=Pseudonocardia asaccharolytica DSM 44247 = NBRC 16224 TaxID=1123024 RepID=A0A511CYC2_9PSEU|nr:SDR family NAD(P)-dependent oxidoreductase [Pseudonocardia asaccharolytica]GEL17560.1 short-chain dehydrogenase [Pseudonocardia asaccharolytica DSM 44247 = NBRC 16224]